MLKRNENHGKDWKWRGEYDIMSPDMISCRKARRWVKEKKTGSRPGRRKRDGRNADTGK